MTLLVKHELFIWLILIAIIPSLCYSFPLQPVLYQTPENYWSIVYVLTLNLEYHRSCYHASLCTWNTTKAGAT